jgi:hypothetical protein
MDQLFFSVLPLVDVAAFVACPVIFRIASQRLRRFVMDLDNFFR